MQTVVEQALESLQRLGQHGDSDRNVVVENGIYQANEIPDATLHKVPGEGHWLYFDHFHEILDSLTSYHARLAARTCRGHTDPEQNARPITHTAPLLG